MNLVHQSPAQAAVQSRSAGSLQVTVPGYPSARAMVNLDMGDYCVADGTHSIKTLLGSCVSITLWHPARKIGAMCHFLLASRGEQVGPACARFCDEALYMMLRDLAALGVEARECEAKIFGGGNMFPSLYEENPFSVGRKNGERARALLQQAGIPVVAEDLYGTGHRQVIFDVGSGDVWLRQIRPVDPQDASLAA
ncbi:MAG: chemotaxis protein CheD [Pseudomonadota bacterium]